MTDVSLAGPVFGDGFIWLLLGLLVAVVVGFVVSIVGIVRAAMRGDTIWLLAIIGAFFFGFSWLVAIVYLLTTRSSSWVRQPAEMPIGPPSHYCMRCGRGAAESANFCVACGGQIKAQARRPFR
jgi:hypothetical protein